MTSLINPYRLHDSTVSYSAEATALFAQMSVPPDTARKALVDTLILALKTGATSASNLWAKMGGLWVLAAHDEQAARLNWKIPASALTAVNSPTFTVDAGFASNGTTSYLDAAAPYSTFGVATLSVHIASWLSGTGTNVYGLGRENTSGTYSLMANSLTTGLMSVRLSHVTAISLASTLVAGYHLATRRSVSVSELYQNGVSIGTSGASTQGVGSGNVHFLKSATSYSPATARLEIAHIGSQLSAAEQLDCYNAFSAYRAGL